MRTTSRSSVAWAWWSAGERLLVADRLRAAGRARPAGRRCRSPAGGGAGRWRGRAQCERPSPGAPRGRRPSSRRAVAVVQRGRAHAPQRLHRQGSAGSRAPRRRGRPRLPGPGRTPSGPALGLGRLRRQLGQELLRTPLPTEQVSPSLSCTCARIAGAISAPPPSRRSAPVTSRNASSRAIGSTSGVNDRKMACTSLADLARSSV